MIPTLAAFWKSMYFVIIVIFFKLWPPLWIVIHLTLLLFKIIAGNKWNNKRKQNRYINWKKKGFIISNSFIVIYSGRLIKLILQPELNCWSKCIQRFNTSDNLKIIFRKCMNYLYRISVASWKYVLEVISSNFCHWLNNKKLACYFLFDYYYLYM